jgi:hypothetical protein
MELNTCFLARATALTQPSLSAVRPRQWLLRAALLGLFLAAQPSFSQSAEVGAVLPPGHADVVGLVGTAAYWTSTNAPLPLRNGASLADGLTLRTGPRSALDLFLGKQAGVARLTENTTVILEKLADPGATNTAPVHIRLNVIEGTLLGVGNRLPLTERYEIKTPGGVAGIGASEFRISARGFVVVLTGRVLYAQVPPNGQPVVHTVAAPPAAYFSPFEGVRPAPRELEREVRAQCGPKLKTR